MMWLSQREHSRLELRQKLLRWAVRTQDAAAEGAAPAPAEPNHEVDVLLDALQADGLLSDQRFVDSRVHARTARFGNRRIEQELRQHGLSVDAVEQHRLRETEFERALLVYRKKFAGTAISSTDRARQARFLAARGFTAETIRAVLRFEDEPN
jgi:regulatory protein